MMKKNQLIFLFITLLMIVIQTSCESQSKSSKVPTREERVQNEVEKLKYEDLFARFQKEDNKLYVVNFWATWCVPCVEELPTFLDANRQKRGDDRLKMYLVSLDFARNVDSLVIPFIQKNQVDAEVLLLDDSKRMNTWIPMVDSTWSGAIPATAIYKNGVKIYFHEGIISEDKLLSLIRNNL